MNYYIYMLSSMNNYTLYVGVTRDLVRRVWEHKNGADPDSFTAKYHVHKLVYYEVTTDPKVAIEREKQLKSWSRRKKNELIAKENPEWKDLYEGLM